MEKENSVSTALARLGFETIGQVSYGKWNEYAITVRHNTPYYYVDAAVRTDKKDKQIAKTFSGLLKERCPKMVLGCANNGTHLTFTATLHRKKDYAEQLQTILEAITMALREQSVSPADTCAVCGREHPDSLCVVTTYQPVHAACVRDMTESTRQAASENEEQGSYLTGLIGGVIGMLVGLIPSLLSILLSDRIYAALFALVPLAAMWGYRKFRGKQSSGSILIIILLSLIGVVVLECLVVAISIKQEFGLGIASALQITSQYLFTREGIGVLLQESISEFLFMVLGIFLAWKFLSQTNSGKVAAMNAVEKTIHPIDGSWDDPDWHEK